MPDKEKELKKAVDFLMNRGLSCLHEARLALDRIFKDDCLDALTAKKIGQVMMNIYAAEDYFHHTRREPSEIMRKFEQYISMETIFELERKYDRK